MQMQEYRAEVTVSKDISDMSKGVFAVAGSVLHVLVELDSDVIDQVPGLEARAAIVATELKASAERVRATIARMKGEDAAEGDQDDLTVFVRRYLSMDNGNSSVLASVDVVAPTGKIQLENPPMCAAPASMG